jgi:precorrin-6Y C5,15-methyltransferase (decarboxylating)
MTVAVAVIGIGEDGLDGLRPDARRVLDTAEVLVGGERHHHLVPQHPAQRLIFKRDTATLADEIDRLVTAGRRVVVLASGDPAFFGIGPLLVQRLGADRVRIYPNVGAVQLAFARIGLAWQDAVVLSAHGRSLEPVVARARGQAKIAILTDADHTPAVVAQALLAGGLEATAQVWCMERLGGPAERIQHGTLADCITWTADPLNTLVILRKPTAVRGQPPRLGLPDEAYAHEGGQITKAEVRLISLARLAPRAGDTVWDVGAGSGSVGLEAAACCQPGGMVYAVERREAQRACIHENIRRFGTPNLEVVAGEAPEALTSLPDPDAVFVGGSGGRLEAILSASLARLGRGGRLVVNLATLEAVQVATACLRGRGLPFDLAQVSIARGVPIAGGTRLAALNPVFILSATSEEASR